MDGKKKDIKHKDKCKQLLTELVFILFWDISSKYMRILSHGFMTKNTPLFPMCIGDVKTRKQNKQYHFVKIVNVEK